MDFARPPCKRCTFFLFDSQQAYLCVCLLYSHCLQADHILRRDIAFMKEWNNDEFYWVRCFRMPEANVKA